MSSRDELPHCWFRHLVAQCCAFIFSVAGNGSASQAY